MPTTRKPVKSPLTKRGAQRRAPRNRRAEKLGPPEEQRKGEQEAMQRERAAFERRQSAFSAVIGQFLPHGNGTPTMESLAEFDGAETQWRAAAAAMDRIDDEIRAGKRR